jgi:hypothetical protein
MNLVPTIQSQVLHKHLNSRVSKFLVNRRRGALHFCMGKWLVAHMDRVNLESFNLKSHTLIDFCFLVICIEVGYLIVHGY